MNVFKEVLLGSYFYATSPYRQWKLRVASERGTAPISIVVFHRVADDRANDWTTPTDYFCEAIRWLKPRFDMISLAEATRRLRTGRNNRPAVCITFDDGYASNCDVALPLLLREGIPCTYFVVTQAVLEGSYFQHDTAIGNRHATNTLEELRDLAREGIDIGGHSRTHADLGQIVRRERLWDEIVTSRDELQSALNTSIRFFAFPYGAPRIRRKPAFTSRVRPDTRGSARHTGAPTFQETTRSTCNGMAWTIRGCACTLDDHRSAAADAAPL